MSKIGIFIFSLGSGGAEKVASNTIKYLKSRHEVQLILMCDIKLLPSFGVKEHFLCKTDVNACGLSKFAQLFPLAFKLKSLCEKENFNTLFCLLNRPNYIAGMAKMLGLKTRVVMNECSTPSEIFKTVKISNIINKILIKMLYKKADLVLANSKEVCEELDNIYKIKAKYLPNMLDLEDIKAKALKPLATFKLKKDSKFKLKGKISLNQKRFLLNIGRLDAGKNQELLIKAYKKSKVKIPLIILGEGVLRQYLQKLILKEGLGEKVFLRGYEANVYRYLSRCVALISSSNYEGFSNVLIEGLACEAVVVSTKHKNGANALLAGGYGLLSPVKDEDKLACNISLVCKTYTAFGEENASNENKFLNSNKKILFEKSKRLEKASEFGFEKIGEKLCQYL